MTKEQFDKLEHKFNYPLFVALWSRDYADWRWRLITPTPQIPVWRMSAWIMDKEKGYASMDEAGETDDEVLSKIANRWIKGDFKYIGDDDV